MLVQIWPKSLKALGDRLAAATAERMTLQKQFAILCGGYLAFATFELLAHWLLAQPLLRIPRLLYSLHTPTGGVVTISDFLFPILLVGWWNGWVGRKSSSRRAVALGLPLAVCTVALIPFYGMLMMADKEAIWWWPDQTILRGLQLAVELFFATIAVLGGVGAYHEDFFVPKLDGR